MKPPPSPTMVPEKPASIPIRKRSESIMRVQQHLQAIQLDMCLFYCNAGFRFFPLKR
jgi:hypothetical protein